tara:strand:+ start:706 stop:1164 length:459 start_codon:yes stop_codon:yes gene_type:complete
MLSTLVQKLPDDIIDKIYSKVIFKQPKNLLNEIIKYGSIREYLYYLNKVDNDILLETLYDISIIYILLNNDIIPSSCDMEQLSTENMIVLENIINSSYDYHGIFDAKYAYDIIYDIMMNIDDYYIEKIIEHNISVIKFDELNSLGYLTYNGV